MDALGLEEQFERGCRLCWMALRPGLGHTKSEVPPGDGPDPSQQQRLRLGSWLVWAPVPSIYGPPPTLAVGVVTHISIWSTEIPQLTRSGSPAP